MQVCISLQTDNHASTPPLSFFTGRMPFLPPNQQRQSTEGNSQQPIANVMENGKFQPRDSKTSEQIWMKPRSKKVVATIQKVEKITISEQPLTNRYNCGSWLVCIESADKILIFVVLTQWLLQQREIEASFVYIIT